MASAMSIEASREAAREIDFNFDWRFHLEGFPGSHSADSDDSEWRKVRLPHDWSVESPFDASLEGCTGYLPGGTAWYRKIFATPADVSSKTVYLHFDGIYNNAEIWLNGHKLGEHPYGYSPFYYEIGSMLREGGENVVAIKVDRRRFADSRWYTGSGIYRDVKLVVTGKLHVGMWGTFVTTPEVSAERAEVSIETTVSNDGAEAKAFELKEAIFDADGALVAESGSEGSVEAASEQKVRSSLELKEPRLWGLDTPHLYTLVTTVSSGGQQVDRYETRFGARSIRFDADEGFFLNERWEKIKGVCLHHDVGLVGAAVPKDMWRRRLKILQKAGCNAVRISHNPASDVLLDLCDEMGILVQEEFFDEWDYPKDKRHNKEEQEVDFVTQGYCKHFHEWSERDLKTTMLRDRNHPSIFQWSIGNEIEWTYERSMKATGFFNLSWEGNYFWDRPPRTFEEIKKAYEEAKPDKYAMGDAAKRLAGWTREMDTSRPVTANCILPSISHVNGVAEVLDVVGYSYRRVMYDICHKKFPDTVIMGAENLGQWHDWKAVQERNFISGTFLWTGADYMGEVNGQWPTKSLSSGLIDLASFEKPAYHMFKTLWNNEPHTYMATQQVAVSPYSRDEATGRAVEKEPGKWERRTWFWHGVQERWNYREGEDIVVEVYSNSPEMELFLNGESRGLQRLEDHEDRAYKWIVPFVEGELQAKGVDSEAWLATAGGAGAITLELDREEMEANAYDVVHVVAKILDTEGRAVHFDDREIEFAIEGDARVLGVDNGAPMNVQPFHSNKIVTHKGRALLALQANREAGPVTIRANSAGLAGARAVVNIIEGRDS